MLESLHNSFRILAGQPPTDEGHLYRLTARFPSVPPEYLQLVKEVTELELQHENGQYIRIWGPSGCIEMDEGYDISKRISGAVPIGDDGGGRVLLYMNGKGGHGLYRVGYGDLDAEDAVLVAPNLTALLQEAIGINTF